MLLGHTVGYLGQSIYLRDLFEVNDGAPPKVDLLVEKKNGDCVRELINSGLITACHDLSDGGLLVGVAEMAIKSGIGADIEDLSGNTALHGWAFGEDQSRYLVTTKKSSDVIAFCESKKVSIYEIGITKGGTLNFCGETILVDELKTIYENWLPNFMEGLDERS